MHKVGTFAQPLSLTIYDAKGSFIKYLIGPITALDQLMNSPHGQAMGKYSFRFFCIIGALLGFKTEVTSLVRDFTFVPVPVNVYTVADPYYRDFGIIGVMIAQLLFGLIHGYIYRRATISKPSATVIMSYGLSLYPLIFQFFQDQYLSLTSTWMQFSLLFLFAFFIRKLYRNKSKNRVIFHFERNSNNVL